MIEIIIIAAAVFIYLILKRKSPAGRKRLKEKPQSIIEDLIDLFYGIEEYISKLAAREKKTKPIKAAVKIGTKFIKRIKKFKIFNIQSR